MQSKKLKESKYKYHTCTANRAAVYIYKVINAVSLNLNAMVYTKINKQRKVTCKLKSELSWASQAMFLLREV